ncbi:DNA topoisomerase IV subunit A [Burkholderia ambifaria]|uniref:DNA topoisomerase IV subunit A n=1 Tax=Burkholderia ambifaria TaxID=152480 RepID=UPI000F810BAA|nr:DNA topoisomerase IV subunit A [Burkholderia ambifaria]
MTDAVLDVPEAQAGVEMGAYAERAYLDYAMSVVMGRALPLGADGQKPVQRRILYDMVRLGLHDKAKPVKCARFVGDILGKYHPHGDSSVYDAAVRMAQNFSLRYPLIDGQGNFGSRDGDSPAAMRYTEARLTPIAELLLGELDMGTVDFVSNYDGTLTEPRVLPARLPVLLLNGASGIAVGMATEIPSHNLTEVALACEHLIQHPDATLEDLLAIVPGPDFPGGAQVISSPEEVAKVYASGRGPLRTRARWMVEQLARGQWQIAITELPPDTSTAKVMGEIEALTNPQIKAGKKSLTQDQVNLKALVLSVVDHISDDSDGQHPVRLVIEPRSSRQSPDEVMQVLLAHTSLELNYAMNLVTIGQDGKPQQKGLLQVLREWVAFRFETVTRRTTHRLEQVKTRSHILEGRLAVFLHIDEVIRIIRGAEDPKAELTKTLGLTDAQATDILEIRLRQLANLEQVKLEAELAELAKEASFLEGLLADGGKMTRQVLLELKADREKFGDARRTLIEAAGRVTTGAVAAAADDPVTLIVSKQGWLRARTGHKVDLSALGWKAGDEALAILEARTNQAIVALDTTGRAYTLSAAAFPTGRGDGVPASSLIELNGNALARVFVLDVNAHYLLSHSGGYGFLCPGSELQTRQKAGKALVTLEKGEQLLQPVAVTLPAKGDSAGEAVFASSAGKLLVCPLAEMKVMGKGRGVQLMTLNGKDRLTAGAAFERPVDTLTLTVPAGKVGELQLTPADVERHRGKRARAGAALPHKAVVGAIQASLTETAARPEEAPRKAAPTQPHPTEKPPAPAVFDFGDSDEI